MREFLHARGVAFKERDISQDDAAVAELETTGVMTTPVTVVDGDAIVGYDVKRLRDALGLSAG